MPQCERVFSVEIFRAVGVDCELALKLGTMAVEVQKLQLLLLVV